tara:strand:+ start:2396 stop:3139 length:744 start_codon:yes stop_codon:yes gene_type:complete
LKIDFSGQIVIVTGGTRGIGASIAELFLSLNAEVIATGTNKVHIQRLNQNSPRKKIKYKHLDFLDDESITVFIDEMKTNKKIKILINNAGVNKIDSIGDISVMDWDMINNINIRGPFILTNAISKIMITNGYGRIINIASIFGTVSKSKRAVYSSSKWGLIGLTKAVALDLADKNILVNAISPGFLDTELTREILSKTDIQDIIEMIPQKRLALPAEIAKTVAFLASEHNSYITGQNIVIDGGFTSA